MKTRVWSLDFSLSRRLPEEWEAERADFRKLSGTEAYCSPEAAGVIREKIREMGCWGIHFLDTGNYIASMRELEAGVAASDDRKILQTANVIDCDCNDEAFDEYSCVLLQWASEVIQTLE